MCELLINNVLLYKGPPNSEVFLNNSNALDFVTRHLVGKRQKFGTVYPTVNYVISLDDVRRYAACHISI